MTRTPLLIALFSIAWPGCAEAPAPRPVRPAARQAPKPRAQWARPRPPDPCQLARQAAGRRPSPLERADVLLGALARCPALRAEALLLVEKGAVQAAAAGDLERVLLARRASAALRPGPASRAALVAARAELARDPSHGLDVAPGAPRAAEGWQALLAGDPARAARLFVASWRRGRLVSTTVGLARALRAQGKHRAARQVLARALHAAEQRHRGQVAVTLRPGHTDYIYSVAIDPHGRVYASGGRDRVVSIRDLFTGRLLRKLPYKKKAHAWKRWGFPSLAFDPSGRLLAGASADSPDVPVWDVRTGRLVRTFSFPKGYTTQQVAIDAAGKRLVAAYNSGHVIVWSLASGKKLCQLKAPPGGSLPTLALGPRGRRLALVDNQSRIKVWRLGRRPRLTHNIFLGRDVSPDASSPLAVGPRGRWLAIGIGAELRLVSLVTGRQRPGRVKWDDVAEIRDVHFLADGRRILLATKKGLRILDLRRGALGRLIGPSGKATPLSRAAVGRHQPRYAVSLHDSDTIRLWDLVRGRSVREHHRLKEKMVWASITSRDVRAAVTRRWSLRHEVWDTVARRRLLDLPVPWASSVALSATRFAVEPGKNRRGVRIYGLPGGALLSTVPVRKRPTRIALSYDGRRIAYSTRYSRAEIWIHDVATGRLVRTVKGATSSFALGPRGRWLVALGKRWVSTKKVSYEEPVRLNVWDLTTGRKLPDHPRRSAGFLFVFDHHDRLYTVVGPKSRELEIWDLARSRRRRRLRLPCSVDRGLAVHPSGRLVLLLHRDNDWWIIDGHTGRTVGRFRGVPGGDWVVWTPDGYVDATPEARAWVEWQLGQERFDGALAWARRHVPGLLTRLLTGDGSFRLSHLRRVAASRAP